MSKQGTTAAVSALIVVVAAVVTGYLLYAVPASDADRLNRQVTTLRGEHATLEQRLASANRRVVAAKRSARAAWSRAADEYAKGRADGLAAASESYDSGYAAGSAAALGSYGADWGSSFYVVRVEGGQIVDRTVLQPCLAVYADQGSVWVEGPAC